jgi:hypothetical protein
MGGGIYAQNVTCMQFCVVGVDSFALGCLGFGLGIKNTDRCHLRSCNADVSCFRHICAIIGKNRTLALIEMEDGTRSWNNYLIYFSHNIMPN